MNDDVDYNFSNSKKKSFYNMVIDDIKD